jgi:hypothetical protein
VRHPVAFAELVFSLQLKSIVNFYQVFAVYVLELLEQLLAIQCGKLPCRHFYKWELVSVL